MALIKLTAIVDNISGKLNGSVFARNKGGHYVRSKSNPINPRTAIQSSARAAFADISAKWRGLDPGQRNAWDGATGDYPYQNRLGDTKTLSGFSLHQKLNRNLSLVGTTVLAVPLSPVFLSTPVDIEFTNTTGAVITVKAAFTSTNADAVILLYATPAISPGINNFANRVRLIGTITGSQLTTGKAITTEYTAKFGAPVIGSKIGLKLVAIDKDTGQASADAMASVLVTI